MSQSRIGSLTEQLLNVGSGFLLALVVWQLLAWWYAIPMSLTRNLEITSIFTVMSVARGYVWRRGFNWYTTRKCIT